MDDNAPSPVTNDGLSSGGSNTCSQSSDEPPESIDLPLRTQEVDFEPATVDLNEIQSRLSATGGRIVLLSEVSTSEVLCAILLATDIKRKRKGTFKKVSSSQ